jgi:hypothetical protein
MMVRTAGVVGRELVNVGIDPVEVATDPTSDVYAACAELVSLRFSAKLAVARERGNPDAAKQFWAEYNDMRETLRNRPSRIDGRIEGADATAYLTNQAIRQDPLKGLFLRSITGRIAIGGL